MKIICYIKNIIMVCLILICLFLVGCTQKHKHEYINGLCNCGETSMHIHSFVDGVCECGKSSEGFKTTIDGFNIEGSTVKSYTGVSTDVVIPERYMCNNEYVFVTTLDKFVFQNAVFGILLEIPRTINNINPQALVGAGNVSNIRVNQYNKTYASVKGDLYSRDKTTLIRFVSNQLLDEYTVLDSVTSIGDFAFAYAMINKLIVGERVTTIGKAAFYGSIISNIEISDKNNNYVCNDNVVYSKDNTTLVYYLPSNTKEEFSIPETVTTIKEAAFYNPFLLKNITVHKNVTTVEENAFVINDATTITCQVTEKPSGWQDNWTNKAINVVWATN